MQDPTNKNITENVSSGGDLKHFSGLNPERERHPAILALVPPLSNMVQMGPILAKDIRLYTCLICTERMNKWRERKTDHCHVILKSNQFIFFILPLHHYLFPSGISNNVILSYKTAQPQGRQQNGPVPNPGGLLNRVLTYLKLEWGPYTNLICSK